jgi:hypothetical protein
MSDVRVLVNVMCSDWSVHFIGPDGQTRIGPWLLLDNHDEVRAILLPLEKTRTGKQAEAGPNRLVRR